MEKKQGSVIYSKAEKARLIRCLLYPVWSSLEDRKRVQDARFDKHLTGVKKESFYLLTKTITHNKGFPKKWKQISPCFYDSSVGPCKKKKTLHKAKKLFKVSLLSLSKDWLVNFLGETSRISAVHYRLQVWSALKFSNTDHILFHGKVTIQFLHQLRSHSNKARLKSGKAKSTS